MGNIFNANEAASEKALNEAMIFEYTIYFLLVLALIKPEILNTGDNVQHVVCESSM